MRVMHKITFLIAYLAISGCSKVCTLAGCIDGIDLVLSLSGDAGTGLPAGEYSVVVMGDGLRSTTTCTVGATESHCTEGSNTSFALVDSEIEILVNGAPASISVTITRDGMQLASRTLAPAYHDNKPNGPDCEPTCKYSQVTIAI
jgi:hypothetical protein